MKYAFGAASGWGIFMALLNKVPPALKNFSVNTIKMHTKPVIVCPPMRFHKTKSIPESINCLRTGKIFGTGLDNLLSLTISQQGCDKDTFPVAWSGFALRYCSLTLHLRVGFLQKSSMILPSWGP